MSAEKLGRLLTDQGERSLYDAVSQCSRCGFCEQACPTYVATGKEAWSARGRNQLVRMLLEGRFKDPKTAEEALSSCLLCGACSSVCPAHVPTADIVLEGRRFLREQKPSLVASLLMRWLSASPRLFSALLKGAYAAKRLGLSRLAARLGLMRLFGLSALADAELHVEEAPRHFLQEILGKRRDLKDFSNAGWLYFSACGPNYVLPRVGEATVRVLQAKCGPGAYLDNSCCGLLFYNYGALDEARKAARTQIERAETLAPGGTPVIVDCSSCAAHMKSYPQLFLEDAAWKTRAEAFAARVKDAVEFLPAGKLSPAPATGRAVYHDSCRARNGEGIAAEPRRALKAVCAGDCGELSEAGACCGGAGAFAFVHPELSEELLKKKIADIAASQARVVATSSTSCLLQLARGLKKYYPECRVVHLTELAAESLDG